MSRRLAATVLLLAAFALLTAHSASAEAQALSAYYASLPR